MDAETWDRQPLWAQMLYREGLEIERPWDIKPSLDPQSWWTPLADRWDDFGDLDARIDKQKEEEKPSDTRPKAEKLPDITTAGRGLKIVKGKGKQK